MATNAESIFPTASGLIFAVYPVTTPRDSSLRTRDCDLYFTTAFIQEPTKARACAKVFGPPRGAPSSGRRLRFALLADRGARAVHIGGTRDIQFFGLAVNRRHWTLIVDRSGDPRTGVYITSLVPAH